MKLLNKIKALFKLNGKEEEVKLISAEIKPGKAYLHTDEDTTLIINSDNISILLDGDYELVSDFSKSKNANTEISPVETKSKEKKIISKENGITSQSSTRQNKQKVENRIYYLQKKTFSLTLYEDEYNYLSEIIKESGHNRSEFIMASINSAKKKSFEQELKK